MHGAIACEVNNKLKLIGLLDFIYTAIGGNVDRSSCQVRSVHRPKDQKLEDANEKTASFSMFLQLYCSKRSQATN